VVVDPADDSTLYVGNDIGVFVSTDSGATWQWFNEGFTEVVAVLDLVATPHHRLRVATHGSGVFERDLVSAILFSDGFESGTTDAWGVVAPG
jgi:hypothetical protein